MSEVTGRERGGTGKMVWIGMQSKEGQSPGQVGERPERRGGEKKKERREN